MITDELENLDKRDIIHFFQSVIEKAEFNKDFNPHEPFINARTLIVQSVKQEGTKNKNMTRVRIQFDLTRSGKQYKYEWITERAFDFGCSHTEINELGVRFTPNPVQNKHAGALYPGI